MSTAAAQIPGAATGISGGVATLLSGHPMLLFNQILPVVARSPEPWRMRSGTPAHVGTASWSASARASTTTSFGPSSVLA